MIDFIVVAIAASNIAILIIVISLWTKTNQENLDKEQEVESLHLERKKLLKDIDDLHERKHQLLRRNADLTLSELKYKQLYLSTKEELSKWVRLRDTTTGRFKKKTQQ